MTPLEIQLMEDEGLRLKPYRDTVGKLTIGIGRNIDDVGISKDEAIYMMRNDIASVQKQLSQLLPFWSNLNTVRQDALTNMAFMGVPKLMQFKNMLSYLSKGQYDMASKEVLNSKYASQVGDRAARIAKQILFGS